MFGQTSRRVGDRNKLSRGQQVTFKLDKHGRMLINVNQTEHLTKLLFYGFNVYGESISSPAGYIWVSSGMT